MKYCISRKTVIMCILCLTIIAPMTELIEIVNVDSDFAVAQSKERVSAFAFPNFLQSGCCYMYIYMLS